jgi:hypothetical protein
MALTTNEAASRAHVLTNWLSGLRLPADGCRLTLLHPYNEVPEPPLQLLNSIFLIVLSLNDLWCRAQRIRAGLELESGLLGPSSSGIVVQG